MTGETVSSVDSLSLSDDEVVRLGSLDSVEPVSTDSADDEAVLSLESVDSDVSDVTSLDVVASVATDSSVAPD